MQELNESLHTGTGRGWTREHSAGVPFDGRWRGQYISELKFLSKRHTAYTTTPYATARYFCYYKLERDGGCHVICQQPGKLNGWLVIEPTCATQRSMVHASIAAAAAAAADTHL